MKLGTKGFVSTLAIGAAALSMAQSNGPHDVSVRLGVQFPRVGSDTNWAAGLDFKLPQFGVPQARGTYQSYAGISADYYGRSDDWNIPIAVTYNVRADALVLSGGVGVDFSRHLGDDQTGIGFQIAATYDFSNGNKGYSSLPIFLQAKYFFAHQSELSGFAAYIGIRF